LQKQEGAGFILCVRLEIFLNDRDFVDTDLAKNLIEGLIRKTRKARMDRRHWREEERFG